MKKVFCLLLSFVMIFPLAACQTESEPAVVQYCANTMAEVAVSYILDGKANIATRPLTEVPLQKITLACIYYDINGKQIGQMKMIDCPVKEQKNATLWQTTCPESATYIDCTVYSVVDMSGKKHTVSGIETWAKTVTGNRM